MVQRPRFFHGWYLVGLMVVSMTLCYGIRHAFAVFFSPILDEFQWYRGTTAIMLSLNVLVYGLVAPVAGSLVDRWKPRKVVFIGIFILSLATFCCAFAGKLWHFYVLFGILVPIGTAFCGSPAMNPTMMNWFGKKCGLAIGLGQIGGGLGFVYGMLVEAVISYWSWRESFYVMAGLLVVILLPLYWMLFYYRPEDKGLKPYRMDDTRAETEIEAVPPPATRDWTLGKAVRTHNLWFLVFAQLCYWGMGNYLVIAHQIKFAVDVGYTSVLAASVFALFGLASIGGQLCASISDVIGREKTVAMASVLAVGAMVALLSVTDNSQPWLLYVFAIVSGFATGLFSPTLLAGLADIFNGRNIGAISALALTGAGVGGALGPWLGGYIYDISGSYSTAFIISLVSYAVAGVSFWIAAPRNAGKLRARTESSVI